MIRYPAFDPPEYNDWKPDPEVVAAFACTLEKDPARNALIVVLGSTQLLALYEGLVRNRLHDIALKRWVKQGVISKAWLGTGEEAATIGPVHALGRSIALDGRSFDFIAPMIRNAGACHEMGMPVADMLRYHLFTVGRFWIPEYGSAEDPEQFGWLRAYSPYHHVRDGERYPAVLLATAESDSRVDPLHARKMTARLQAATASDRPILLRLESRAGHGAGKPLSKVLDELTDTWAFVFSELGVEV